jgi:hydrogenase expression/formation protein HypE
VSSGSAPPARGRSEERVLRIVETARAKPPRLREDRIALAHGAGGKASRALVEGLIAPALAPAGLTELSDAAAFAAGDERLALTADAYVVKPISFPGGSIGELAVNGTVNDLAVAGARPLAISLALIIEEGLAVGELERELNAAGAAARAAGVSLIAGDTKVVERGGADPLYVCTTGVGRLDDGASLDPASIRAGDRILVSGPIAAHGTAIMLARGEFELEAEIASDTRSLWPAAKALIDAAGSGLRCMRDATRGGVATVLNELARASAVGLAVREADVPVHGPVAAACELLGIDPMYVANEGVLVAAVADEAAGPALAALREAPGCGGAAEIGVAGTEPGTVLVETAFGGRRVLDMLVGDPLPRIC